jgi:hypothetical protein
VRSVDLRTGLAVLLACLPACLLACLFYDNTGTGTGMNKTACLRVLQCSAVR